MLGTSPTATQLRTHHSSRQTQNLIPSNELLYLNAEYSFSQQGRVEETVGNRKIKKKLFQPSSNEMIKTSFKLCGKGEVERAKLQRLELRITLQWVDASKRFKD